MTTDWRAHVSPLDCTVNGFVQPVPRRLGDTAPVSMDVASWLAEGESVTDPESTLRKLPAVGETDYTDVDILLDGSPSVADTIISQGFANLDRGAVYRWDVTFGSAINRRGPSVMIESVE